MTHADGEARIGLWVPRSVLDFLSLPTCSTVQMTARARVDLGPCCPHVRQVPILLEMSRFAFLNTYIIQSLKHRSVNMTLTDRA